MAPGSDQNSANRQPWGPKSLESKQTLSFRLIDAHAFVRLISDPTRFVSRLAFQYPADDRAKWATFEAQQDAAMRDAEAVADQKRAQDEQAKDKQAGVLPLAENALDNLYFDYKLSGDPAYRPERVLDDGQHTYLIYPSDRRFRELPTLLMVEERQNWSWSTSASTRRAGKSRIGCSMKRFSWWELGRNRLG